MVPSSTGLWWRLPFNCWSQCSYTTTLRQMTVSMLLVSYRVLKQPRCSVQKRVWVCCWTYVYISVYSCFHEIYFNKMSPIIKPSFVLIKGTTKRNVYVNSRPTRCNTKQSIYYSASSLYMFRVSNTPIIQSTQNCNYILLYWSCCAVQLPPPMWPNLATLEGVPVTEAVVTVLCTPDEGYGWPLWRELAAQNIRPVW